MRDWQAELDELFRQTAGFARTVELKAETPRMPPRAVVQPLTPPAAAKFGSSDREEIARRVASFKAHQQRAIREREEYASSVLVRMKLSLEAQS